MYVRSDWHASPHHVRVKMRALAHLRMPLLLVLCRPVCLPGLTSDAANSAAARAAAHFHGHGAGRGRASPILASARAARRQALVSRSNGAAAPQSSPTLNILDYNVSTDGGVDVSAVIDAIGRNRE